MKRKKFIEYLEELQSKAAVRISELMSIGDTQSLNYQIGKSVAYRTAIKKLKEQDEKEVGE